MVVNLYNWRSEDDMIHNLGVNMAFLLKVRDTNKLIVLAANQPPESYRELEWMHNALGDEKTIWRSIRTPGFMVSKNPTFESRRANREEELARYFRDRDHRFWAS